MQYLINRTGQITVTKSYTITDEHDKKLTALMPIAQKSKSELVREAIDDLFKKYIESEN